MIVLFWISLFIVFYSYIGYGMLVWVLIRLRKLFGFTSKTIPDNTPLPAVTLVVAAYNEEDFIAEKIRNTHELDYPEELLHVFFVTDGSSDRTPELVREHSWITLLHSPERRGKVAAMNRAMKLVKDDIVIFCDANTLLNKNCIRSIVQHYARPEIGGVAGEKKIMKLEQGKVSAAGEGLYWKYESFLKKLDAEFYTVVGAAGELFSVRTHLYEMVPEDVLLDDFIISLRICQKGYIIQYEPGAYAMETASSSMSQERKRKIRISAGGFQSIVMLKDLLNIFKYGKLSFQYISHRVLRWTLCPVCLLLLLISNIVVVMNSGAVFYQVLLAGQLLFYCLAGAGWLLSTRNIKVSALYVPYYFTFMNVAVFIGFARFMKGKQTVLWEKAARQQMPS